MSAIRVDVVAESDLDELLPLVRAYCDFYEVDPSDAALIALSHALIADPELEGVQLLARDDDGRAIGFASLFWTWATTRGVPTLLIGVDPAVGFTREAVTRCLAWAAS